jgi:sugar phosphate isomerase/epimerase
MRFVYFTKTLQKLDISTLVSFCKDAGLDGLDLTVRPGYPVTPENAAVKLPEAVKQLRDNGLIVGLVTAPTTLSDPESKQAKQIFDACAKAAITAVKIGYFPYRAGIEEAIKDARKKLQGFAKLSEATKVKACYHTHSGSYLGNNAAGLRMLLADLDPHHLGAFFDTGHTAINGGPARMELDLLRQWLHLVAIKDMSWTKAKGAWSSHVVPVGGGIVKWADVGKGLKEVKFDGVISLHGEYEAKDLDERKKLAKEELTALKKWFA